MKKIILVILLLFASPVQATEFNLYQAGLLKSAYYYGNIDGWPETVQAILLQESLLGISWSQYIIGDIDNSFGRRSYGRMQIQLATAHFIIEWYRLERYVTEEELIARLIVDNEYNIILGSLYFKYLYKRFNNWDAAVVAYNRGPNWVDRNYEKVSGNKYLRAIRQLIINKVRPFNKKLER